MPIGTVSAEASIWYACDAAAMAVRGIGCDGGLVVMMWNGDIRGELGVGVSMTEKRDRRSSGWTCNGRRYSVPVALHHLHRYKGRVGLVIALRDR